MDDPEELENDEPYSVDYWWDMFEIEEEEFDIYDHAPPEIDIARLREIGLSPEQIADLLRMIQARGQANEEYKRWLKLEPKLMGIDKLKKFLNED